MAELEVRYRKQGLPLPSPTTSPGILHQIHFPQVNTVPFPGTFPAVPHPSSPVHTTRHVHLYCRA